MTQAEMEDIMREFNAELEAERSKTAELKVDQWSL